MKKTTDILIIIFTILVVSSIAFVIIGIFVIQDKYNGEPETAEFIEKIITKEKILFQQNDLTWIKNRVNEIDESNDLIKTEFDWNEITGTATDGGGTLTVWQNKNYIIKIEQEIGLSYGRIRTIIYLDKGVPIKIIDTEENFGYDKSELNEVFKGTIYVFEWENDNSKIERIGKRVLSEGSCSTFDHEPVLERAEKATSE